jgi:hypothetical protein
MQYSHRVVVPMKLVRLFKTCANETYSKACITMHMWYASYPKWSKIRRYCGVTAQCGSCWNAETSKRDCTTAVSDVFPSPRFVPHHALLGDTVNAGSRNSKEGSHDLHDITCNSTQCHVSCMSDSGVYSETLYSSCVRNPLSRNRYWRQVEMRRLAWSDL